jgi:hypothetical protein
MAKKRPTTSKREKHFLPCLLTSDEEKAKGRELAALHTRLQVLESQKKAFNDEIKSKVAGTEANISTISQQISTGIEHRDVNCFWQYDRPTLGDKTLIREDTMEIVRIEEMTDDDKQAELDLED